MYITDVSIRRPVVAWVMSLILIVFGIFVFSQLPVRELPDGLQPPVVQIKVDYKSASAPIIDQEVTQVIEKVIGGIEGVKNITNKNEVVIGIRDNGFIEIVSGLSQGDNIVAEGLKKVRPRLEIKPIKKGAKKVKSNWGKKAEPKKNETKKSKFDWLKKLNIFDKSEKKDTKSK